MPRSTSRSTQLSDRALANKLIDAAEMLYATHGIGGVSLRQISSAAGSGNNYAVQYHFGTAEGLIRGILESRVPEIELKRAALLAKAKADNRLKDLRALNEVLYLPLLEHCNARGERWFPRFVQALFTSAEGLGYAIGTEQLTPISEHILDLQAALTPAVPAVLLRERHRWLAILILTSVFTRHGPVSEELERALIEHALDMATAALQAPVSKSVRTMLTEARRSAVRRTKA
jgi:AcrR family transcriptional regulator